VENSAPLDRLSSAGEAGKRSGRSGACLPYDLSKAPPNDPRSREERVEVAQTCSLRMHIRMPVLLDALDNRVARAYGGWPDRLYLVGKDGRIAWQGEPGPFGFKPEELESAIAKALQQE